MHPLLFRNPACSCLSFLSIAVPILPRSILQKTLLGMDKSVIPRFFRDLYNESFAPVTWDSLFVPNGVEQVSQDSRSCTEVGLQHFSMNVVYAWGFSTLHRFNGISNFGFCWRTGVDVEVIWLWWGVGGFIWLRVVQDFTEIFNPSISCNSAAIFAFTGAEWVV